MTWDDGRGPSQAEIDAHQNRRPAMLYRGDMSRDPQYIAATHPEVCLMCLRRLEPGRRYVCVRCHQRQTRRWGRV